MWSNPTRNTTKNAAAAPSSTASSTSTSTSTSSSTYKLKYQGRRIAQIVRLKPECVEAYKECHARVWPEVLKQIKNCNIEDYSIFHDPGTSILFASFKYIGYDYAGDMERMRENAKVQEWWRMTDSYQESLVDGATGSTEGEPAWWKRIDEVFYTP